MRNYIHIIKNLPGILARIESELQSKASSTSVAALTARLGQKADIKATGDTMARIADELEATQDRLADRPTKADLTIATSDLGARLDKLEFDMLAKVGNNDLIALEDLQQARLEALQSRVTDITGIVERTGLDSLSEALEGIQKASDDTLRQDIRDSIANAVAKVEAEKTVATLSAEIDTTETIAFVDDLRDQVMNGKMTPNQAREALGKAPMPGMDVKVTKARKPKAPKDGGAK